MVAKEPDKIVWKAWKATSLAAFTRSHRGSLVFRVIRACSTIPLKTTRNYELFFRGFDDLESHAGRPRDVQSNRRVFTLHHLIFGIPLPWSTWQENCSGTLDKKNCQILFYSPGEWGTTNGSIPPSKQLRSTILEK